jgi:aminoglycoside phosphotransferase (APT) family kinase protein
VTTRTREVLADGFSRWFAARADPGRDGSPKVVVERPQPGLSSDTLLLTVDDHDHYVARLPPLGGGLFPDYDLARQHRVQRALADTAIPVASSLALETDESWIGAPFLLMPRIAGHTLATQPPYLTHGWLAEAPKETQAALIDRFLTLLADIHRLDVARHDVGELSGGGPTLLGMLEFWHGYLDWADVSPTGAAIYREALRWCRDNLPEHPPPAGLLWGDPQLVNLVIGDGGGVAAALDWEMASLGPAEIDLSWFLVLHEHAAETAGAELPGWPGRAAVIEAYAAKLGREIADLHWYDVFANLRSGAIVLRIGAIMAAAGHSATWTAEVPQHRALTRLIGVPST